MSSQRLPYLVKAIAENSDEQAFDELFRMYYPALLSYTRALIRDHQTAEEICVDVFLKLWQSRKMLPTIRHLSHYLYIAAKHGVISHTRSRGYKQQQVQVGLDNAGEHYHYELYSHEHRLIEQESLQQINAAINSLPARCRLIFKLVKEDGLKYREVAQLLEVSVKTVENQMTIALKKLAAVLLSASKNNNQQAS